MGTKRALQVYTTAIRRRGPLSENEMPSHPRPQSEHKKQNGGSDFKIARNQSGSQAVDSVKKEMKSFSVRFYLKSLIMFKIAMATDTSALLCLIFPFHFGKIDEDLGNAVKNVI